MLVGKRCSKAKRMIVKKHNRPVMDTRFTIRNITHFCREYLNIKLLEKGKICSLVFNITFMQAQATNASLSWNYLTSPYLVWTKPTVTRQTPM